MSRTKIYYEQCYPAQFVVRPARRYGFFSFLFDLTMTFLTCGLWLIWVIIRGMRG